MKKKLLLLGLCWGTITACSNQNEERVGGINVNTAASITPRLPYPRIWIEPHDKTVGVEKSPIRVAIESDKNFINLAGIDYEKKIKLQEIDTAKNIDIKVEVNQEKISENKYRTYLTLVPASELKNEWHQVVIARDFHELYNSRKSRVHTMDGAKALISRFNIGNFQTINEVKICTENDNASNAFVTFTMPVEEKDFNKLKLKIKNGTNCNVHAKKYNKLKAAGAKSIAEQSIAFKCNKLKKLDSVEISGVDQVGSLAGINFKTRKGSWGAFSFDVGDFTEEGECFVFSADSL